jgi:hypothetical protein
MQEENVLCLLNAEPGGESASGRHKALIARERTPQQGALVI